MPGVAIPVINQRVDTPSFDAPPNPFHAEPLDNTLGPAISKAGSDLMGVWEQQNQAQRALDLSDRMGKFQTDFGAAKVGRLSSGQQAPDMVKGLQTDANKLIEKYTSDPSNSSIAPQLSLLMRDHVGREMGGFPSEATLQVHHDTDFKASTQIDTAAQSAAAAYDPQTLEDTGTGKDLTDHAQAMIAGIYDPKARPVEYQVALAKFNQAKDVQRASFIAEGQPAALTPYLAAHPGKYTADEVEHFHALALGTLRQHSEIVGAGVADDHASAIDTLDQLKQSQDPGLPAKTAALYRTGYIDQREADRYVPGFEPPSDKPLVDDTMEAIKTDPSTINSAQFLDPRINAEDRGRLNRTLAFYGKQQHTEIGQADKLERQRVAEALTPTDPAVLSFRDDRAKAELVKQRALAEYDSGRLAAKHGADIYKLGDEIMKKYGVAATAPPPLSPAIPSASVPSAADRIRGAGLGR
jgi:hypothetical protein